MTKRAKKRKRRDSRAEMFRKREREHVKAARYFLRHGDYLAALRSVSWALQQATAADESDYWETKDG